MSYWVKQYYVQFVVILVVFVCILYNDIHIIRFKSFVGNLLHFIYQGTGIQYLFIIEKMLTY